MVGGLCLLIEMGLRGNLIPESCTKYRSEAQKALCLKRSWNDFDPQAYYLYGEMIKNLRNDAIKSQSSFKL